MTAALQPIVALDAGNTRIKWGLHDGAGWCNKGVLATADAACLRDALDTWPANARIVICNVAGPVVGEQIASCLAAHYDDMIWLQASAQACGVRNTYEQAAQLGADRWAALIGARGLVSGACLVVCAGTATTVDLLAENGEFRGGLILPGFDLMRGALAGNTAQLPFAEGTFCREPRNTMDAIVSGCLHAQAGAIERMFATIAGEEGAVCLLTGGGSARLAPHLNIPLLVTENLILDGLVRAVRLARVEHSGTSL
jgi:type III pantothenate kinase